MATAYLLAAGLHAQADLFPDLTVSSVLSDGFPIPINDEKKLEKFVIPTHIFDEILFLCTAPYLINWIFAESPIYNRNISDIRIRTQRVTNSSTFHYPSYSSTLRMKFKSKSRFDLTMSIGCQSLGSGAGGDYVTRLESGAALNYVDRQKGMITFRIFRQSKINYALSSKRPGENRNCDTNFNYDKEKNLLTCTYLKSSRDNMPFKFKNKQNSQGQAANKIKLVHVTNINEIEALVNTGSKCKSIKPCNPHYDPNCILAQVSTLTVQSAAVAICGGYGATSAAIPIFRHEYESQLYFNFEDFSKYHHNLTVFGNDASLRTEIPQEFTCTGSMTVFTSGFYWALLTPEGRAVWLGNGIDVLNEDRQICTSKANITFPSAGLFNVACYGPIWNSTEWKTSLTTQLNVTNGDDLLDTNAIRNTFQKLEIAINSQQQISNNTTIEKLEELFGINIPIIIVILVSVFVTISCCTTILLVMACRKIRRQSRQLQILTEEEVSQFEKGNPQAETALLLPYNVDFEVNKDKLNIGTTVLGNGHYGEVRKGSYGSVPVAVKTIKKSADSIYLKALLSELKIMCYVGPHAHIVNIVGASTKDLRKGDVCLVFEYCAYGNMQKFLKSSRKLIGESLQVSTLERSKPQLMSSRNSRGSRKSSLVSTNGNTLERKRSLTIEDLILWSQQIASAMDYVASKNIIHGDLAARNVLITDKLQAKLGDFGLAKQLFDYSIYIQKHHCPLPLKWMAPESLRDMEFSIQSDIWSYGVTLWEIFSLGELPYPGVDWNYESWKMLSEGFRMEKPRYASQLMYKIMLECWQKEPSRRPTFKFLSDYFAEELRQQISSEGRNPDTLFPPIFVIQH